MKIFGLGLSRTGTSSLGQAIDLLGFPTIHYPYDSDTYQELTCGNYKLSVLKKYDAVVDISVAPFYAQLDIAFPGSKFILTVRDEAAWLASMKSHFSNVQELGSQDAQFERFTNYICSAVYGVLQYEESRLRWAKDHHVRSVLDYFSGRPNDLLVMDICAGDRWAKLAPFLGKPIPTCEFPSSNYRSSATEWAVRLARAYKKVGGVVEEGSEIILVDDAKLAGAFTKRFRTRPFLEKERVYWGPPANDEEAILGLEKTRKNGLAALVFTWPAFWWMEHYRSFATYLNENYDVLLRDEDVIVFKLQK